MGMSIEEWTEASHAALLERVMDLGAMKTPTEHASMVEIAQLRKKLADKQEECAKIAESLATPLGTPEQRLAWMYACKSIAKAIRE